jgi:radical SAM family uncharacterized protein/radical SAM-linked protein
MRHPYADFVDQVERPARYLGGEYQSVCKDPGSVDASVVLAFPDTYEIGMSHLGTKILYSLLNKHPRIACERAFAPWTDMEAQLRQRGLPLVSLESARALSDFDVVGVSLQYEMTYTNVLTLLDLGGIPLRAKDRSESHPLVLGGGPTASHPEPMAPFFDAFFIGEAEEELPGLLLDWARLRKTLRRLDALAELAAKYPLYVPALYGTVAEPLCGFEVVGEPLDARAPRRVRRGLVEDLNKFPFPSDTPVPYAEAVFDRAAVEIARGCTEGCRFCQAGMIYRPVRERSPDSIVESILGNVEKGGYDETSLTCLSTADYSCITPLVKTVMSKLRDRKVSLAVSSLRAYGLNEDLLDELSSVRATGLTFAPEAGTQRMRDVVNKNVTEDHIRESAERGCWKGWSRLKLYFMIGLPTEQDEDVRGIVETGARMLAIGKRSVGAAAEVTVSVSSHVPKPHTPFQWCQMDTLSEIERKQQSLRETARSVRPSVRLKYHEKGISHVEGILARGDRRLADVIEHAWRDGARFDGWDEMFDLSRWQRALEGCGVPPLRYLGTIPVDARLPWDHIDIGLEDGFLLKEYKKALKDRLSPPCGKPFGSLLHHTNLEEALADKRKLVCFDCGVACDLTQMREERLHYLRILGAETKPEPKVPVAPARKSGRRPEPRPQFVQGEGHRYRLRYTKLGRAAFISHLDVMRLLARVFRRADVPVCYSLGFHPKPCMSYSPALGLGVSSLGELVDVKLDAAPDAEELRERLNQVSPEGMSFTEARALDEAEPALARLIAATDFVFGPAKPGKGWDEPELRAGIERFLSLPEVTVLRRAKPVDVRRHVHGFDVLAGDAQRRLCAALDWPQAPALLTARLAATSEGSIKPSELVSMFGLPASHIARLPLELREASAPVTEAVVAPDEHCDVM